MKRLAVPLLVLAACSGNGFKSPINYDAEEIHHEGEDVVARREHDNTVTVIVTRVVGQAIGTGAIRVRAPDIQAATRSPHLRLARARAFHSLAWKLEADPERAYEAAKLGIDELGTDYSLPRTNDDTSSMVGLSVSQRQEPDKVPFAAERMRKALRSRLRMYATRYKSELL